MNVLTLSRLFPNSQQPNHGIFVANRVQRLARRRNDNFRVLAPIPRAPFSARHTARGTDVAQSETLGACTVEHPRFCSIPKLGFPFAALFLYLSVTRHIERLLQDGYRFDLIDAHFYYPDGVAGVWLGRKFGRPVVITARGSDLNIQANLPVVGHMIRWALARADWTITVSEALRRRAVALGAPEGRVTVLRNGVDLEMFRPLPRPEIRQRLGLGRMTLLSVGNLVSLKGHDLVIRALLELPEVELLIVGDGPERAALEALIARLGLSQRARMLGTIAYREMPAYFSAADVLVLASSREGWPNVLLEAMACGTPAVATAVGGIPEIITSGAAGLIVDERSPAAIAAAVRRLQARAPVREEVRAHAEQFGWDDIIDRQLQLFDEILRNRTAAT